MNKDEIRKMANTCENYHSCALCPYNPEDISRFIGDKWKGGCPNYDRKLVYAMGKGYRKVTDDEMVIKKSEYAKLCIVEYEAADETTREILRGVRKIVVGSGTWRQAYDILVARLAKERGIELE